MFDSLSDRLSDVFKTFSGRGRLTKDDVEVGLREVRMALLEADVNVKIARGFVDRIHDRAVGTDVLESLTPAQQLIKIVNDELVELLGGDQHRIVYSDSPPTVILLEGLQGSGKTTTAVKLARLIRKDGHRPLLAAADIYRPAAAEQLSVLAKESDLPCVMPEGEKPVAICQRAIKEAARLGSDVVIIDTAGRLQIDDAMLEELEQIRAAIHVDNAILVVDAMTGQEAVNVGKVFNERVGVDGIILTKLDGDARGGGALSMREAVGASIMYCGVGERLDEFEPFYPDRMASRILGMGDVLTMIEKAQVQMSEKDAQEIESRMLEGRFSLDDFVAQLQQLRKMGSLEGLMGLVPGGRQMMQKMGAQMPTEKDLSRVEAIIHSMTLHERKKPEIINGSRRKRIARGSGVQVAQVNRLLKDFVRAQQMMKQLGGVRSGKKGGGLRQTARMMRQLKGIDPTMFSQ